MKARVLITKLLIVLLATMNGATARPMPVQDTGDATKITAGEEREVLEVAERFVRRMEETYDLAPLIGEMFVSDYAERLRREAINEPLFLVKKGVAKQAGREDLLRYQVAYNNCLYVVGLLYAAYEASRPAADGEGEDIEVFSKVLPPGVLDLFKNDPILACLFEEEQKDRARENQSAERTAKSDSDDSEPIRSVEQLRSFTSTLERANALARKHLDASPSRISMLERHKGASEEENREAERDWTRPRAWVLGKESYGYPEGTRIFCANVLMYHMDLVRVDGKMKVLALYLNTD
ncbi:MAG TPA: hypothetical protein VK388_01125 [Pyrinomonadaceae bacterium]|nr:hypothetical protein [Pyrinomonadaceae bacterium]